MKNKIKIKEKQRKSMTLNEVRERETQNVYIIPKIVGGILKTQNDDKYIGYMIFFV